jgi:ABC-type branched-subunit amino acid transport system substrate-binding protein
MSKWRLFSTFVAAAAIVAAFASVITYLTVLKEPVALPIRLALIAPMTGPDSGIGRSMQEGVQQWLSETQLRGGVAGHAIDLVTFDEVADPDAAVKVAADREVVGVIGPFGAGSAARARATLQSAGIPMLSFGNPANEPADQTGGVKPWSFELLPRPEQEIRFLANYVRNVLGERLVSIILPDTPEGHALSDDFDEVLQRFGTRVVYRWAIEGSDSQADGTATQALHNAAAEINDKKIAGTILLLGPPRFVAASLWALRGANVPNRIVGTRSMATNEFQIALKSFSPDRDTTDAALNGAVVTTPLLFDTAGNAAQGFRDHLTALNGEVPDWAAVLAYDAASGFGRAVATLPRPRRGDPEQAPVQLREPIRAQFAGRNGPDRYFQGLAGPIFFERDGDASLPELVGTYNGSQLVAALTQLSPIREQGVSNYLEELTSGRALYVNDRFMYKTNVVYSGIRLEKVTELNTAANYADIEFVVWFRWRGTLDPQDVVFPNAVTALKLGAPEREGSSGDLNYRAYRVRGKFYMNGSNEQHRFGTQAIEVQFHHRTLSRNNLMYVTDVLGMGLDRAPAPASGEDWLRRLVGVRTEVSPLTKQLETDRVLAGVSGWLVDRSWLAQELSQHQWRPGLRRLRQASPSVFHDRARRRRQTRQPGRQRLHSA